MIKFMIKPNNLRGFFRYRWMVNYLVVPDFFDRHTEGMRGTQLRLAYTGIGLIVKDMCNMKWLNELIGSLLTSAGLDISERWGGSIQFFIYDVIKITFLLCFLIFIISYIQSYFPPERSKKIMYQLPKAILSEEAGTK